MKYDLVQILKDSFPIIGENEIANELINCYIVPFNNSTCSISADCINIEEDSNGNKHYIDVIDDDTVHICKLGKNSTEHYSFKIEDEANFIVSYFNYALGDNNHILQCYQFNFENTNLTLAKGGKWYYSKDNINIIESIKTVMNNALNNTDYFRMVNTLVKKHYVDYRITPDIYHTLIIDKEFRIYKEDNNGVVTEKNNFENIDILSSFDDFADLDIVIDEKSKNYYALLNNFLKLKHIIDHIKSQRKENTNNRQYIKLFDIKNKKDDN